MNIRKKIISILTTVILITVMSVPAFAATVVLVPDGGNVSSNVPYVTNTFTPTTEDAFINIGMCNKNFTYTFTLQKKVSGIWTNDSVIDVSGLSGMSRHIVTEPGNLYRIRITTTAPTKKYVYLTLTEVR